MDLISVIVPVYKVETYLDRCVQSIADQTYRNLEIILVDDGSPDNCPAMCDAWAQKDGRIRVIHKENGGPSSTRNAGLDAAQGEYLCFVDSDDWVHPQYVELLYNTCTEYDVSISGCDYSIVSDYVPFESAVSKACTLYDTEQALEQFIHGRLFRAVVWNKLYHRNILKDVRFPVGRNREDEFFSFQVLVKAPRLVYIDAPLYSYYQRPGSFMNSVSVHHLDVLDAYLERMAFLKKNYPRLYLADKATFCITCVNFYLGAKQLDSQDRHEYRRRIKDARATIGFTLHEFTAYSPSQIVYILGSKLCMDLFCKLLSARRKACL